MGFITRRVVPRGVRRAMSPVSAAKGAARRAVVPKSVRKATYVLSNPVGAATYAVIERPLGEALAFKNPARTPEARRAVQRQRARSTAGRSTRQPAPYEVVLEPRRDPLRFEFDRSQTAMREGESFGAMVRREFNAGRKHGWRGEPK